MDGKQNNYEIKLNPSLKGSRINNTTLIPHFTEQGKVIGYCVLSTDITDITDSKSAEAYTEENNKELSKALKKIERSNMELEQFASACSHDLKEPLRMVKGYVDLLQKRYAHLFDGKAITYLHYISTGTKRMEELVQGLLEYARLEDPDRLLWDVNLTGLLKTWIRSLGKIKPPSLQTHYR